MQPGAIVSSRNDIKFMYEEKRRTANEKISLKAWHQQVNIIVSKAESIREKERWTRHL
jgi:hypothetical protein